MISTQQVLSLHSEFEAVKREWEHGAEPDARKALLDHPGLRASKNLAVDLAWLEFERRWKAGERPDPDEFCDRFPTLRRTLRQILAGYVLLDVQVASGLDILRDNPPPVRWPKPGQRVGDLTLLRPLGRGAFGRVFLAREESAGGRPVAVKFSREGGADEAKTMGRLAHPNIVPVFSVRLVAEVGLTAVCMPFLGAATLTDVFEHAYPTPDAPPPRDAAVIDEAVRAAGCSDDPPPLTAGRTARPEGGLYVDAVARAALQIADALTFLHGQGVIHRDLKPSNVLVRPDGEALLLDFNLSDDERVAAARIGGTLPYMPPEQLRAFLHVEDDADVRDGRMDLFALGVMLYELLTGKHPFGAPPVGQKPEDGARALLERQSKGCKPLRALNPSVDRDLARLVESCIAFEASDRPASAADLAARLRRSASRLTSRLRRWAGRRPLIAAAAAGLLLLAAGGSAGSLAAPQLSADVRQYNRGVDAYAEGDYRRAEALFDQAMFDCPSDRKPRKYYQARAAAAMRLSESGSGGQWTAALTDLQQALDQQPDGPTWARMGYCIIRSAADHRSAINCYSEAIKAGFTSAALYNDRGYSHYQLGHYDQAAQDFELALRSDPTLQAAIVNRARLVARTQISMTGR